MGVRSVYAYFGGVRAGLQFFDGGEICLREPGRRGSGFQLFDGVRSAYAGSEGGRAGLQFFDLCKICFSRIWVRGTG